VDKRKATILVTTAPSTDGFSHLAGSRYAPVILASPVLQPAVHTHIYTHLTTQNKFTSLI